MSGKSDTRRSYVRRDALPPIGDEDCLQHRAAAARGSARLAAALAAVKMPAEPVARAEPMFRRLPPATHVMSEASS